MKLLLVEQLHFARSEFIRCLDGVGEVEAAKRFVPMNSISWIVGHLADQENRYWIQLAQGAKLVPELRSLVGYGRPPSTPPLDEMWKSWRVVTERADVYLNELTPDNLPTYFEFKNRPVAENIGTMLLRNIYHYWFHIGEAFAIRQLLGHKNLPEFVGNMEAATYSPD